jgi:uncharacterized damage-inducible protein DinB
VEREAFELEADGRAILRSLWEHHWWSAELLLEEARGMSEEELTRSLPVSYGSFLGAMAHLVGSEMVWLMRVERDESPASIPGIEELPTLDAVELEWQRCRQGWRVVLDSEDLLRRTLFYRNTKGSQYRDPLWRVLTHLVDHGAAYRGTLIAALRMLGRTPPVTGLAFYTRQKGK